MRILHVIPSMDPASGGPCQGIRNLDQALKESGVHREVVSLDNPTAAFLGTDSFEVHAVGPSTTSWQYSRRLYPWLVANLNRFDVVIINGIWAYQSYAAISAWKHVAKSKKKQAVPAIYIMPHGMLDPYFQKAPERKLKAIRNWFFWKLVERRNIETATGLLFTCQVELELARQTFIPYRPKKELNIGYGVADLPDYTTGMQAAFLEKCPAVKDRPFILSLSRIDIKKGIDILVEAYARVATELKKTNSPIAFPSLVVAGPGMETAFGQKVKDKVAQFTGMEDCIFFPGMLQGDAKFGALYSCDAFILASHQENFGIAVAEALACKTPVLITNQVNIWKEIAAGNGGLVETDTVEGIEKMLRKWIQLTDQEKAMYKQNARTTYEKYFTIQASAKKFVQQLRK